MDQLRIMGNTKGFDDIRCKIVSASVKEIFFCSHPCFWQWILLCCQSAQWTLAESQSAGARKTGMGLFASPDPCPRVGQVTVNLLIFTSTDHLRNKLMRNHTTGVEITDLSWNLIIWIIFNWSVFLHLCQTFRDAITSKNHIYLDLHAHSVWLVCHPAGVNKSCLSSLKRLAGGDTDLMSSKLGNTVSYQPIDSKGPQTHFSILHMIWMHHGISTNFNYLMTIMAMPDNHGQEKRAQDGGKFTFGVVGATLWQMGMLCRNHMWERWRGQIDREIEGQRQTLSNRTLRMECRASVITWG